jgi:hypothetical protein
MLYRVSRQRASGDGARAGRLMGVEFGGSVSRQAVWYGSQWEWVCSRQAEGQGWRSVGLSLVTRVYLTNSRSAGLGCARDGEQ